MAKGDLTTLAHVKEWLGIDAESTDSDALLKMMISSASRFVLGYLNRPNLGETSVTETYDGYGNNFMSLRQWPVLSIASIDFYGQSITQPSTGNPRSPGYILNEEQQGPSRVTLWGNIFPRGRSAISVTYRYGYVTEQCGEVPPAGTDPVTPPTITTDFLWLEDEGVKDANGVDMLRVDENPAAGEYSVSVDGYIFNDDQIGDKVCIRYSYVPSDIEQAVYQMVGEQFRYKDRIGIKSKSLSGGVGETISFSEADMSPYVKTMLQPYKRVI